MTITVQRVRIGSTVIWRDGMRKSKTRLPLGIADCKVLDLGTGPSGEEMVQIELPKFFGERLGCNPAWVYADDIEGGT